jgi:hypothetical protein
MRSAELERGERWPTITARGHMGTHGEHSARSRTKGSDSLSRKKARGHMRSVEGNGDLTLWRGGSVNVPTHAPAGLPCACQVIIL